MNTELLERIMLIQELGALEAVSQRYTNALSLAPDRLLQRRREIEDQLWSREARDDR